MTDADLALSILRKFAEGVHNSDCNWFDPDGVLDGRIKPTDDERELMERLNVEATAKAEAEYAAEQQALIAKYGACDECGQPRRPHRDIGTMAVTGIVCSLDASHRSEPFS